MCGRPRAIDGTRNNQRERMNARERKMLELLKIGKETMGILP